MTTLAEHVVWGPGAGRLLVLAAALALMGLVYVVGLAYRAIRRRRDPFSGRWD